MSRKDYYSVLDVPEDASAEAVKKAYRALAKKYHPDRNPGDEEAEKRFKEIQEAYDVVGDPEKRKKYDSLRKAGANGFAGMNFEDLFGGGSATSGAADFGFGGSIFDLFERIGVGRGRRRGPTPARGDDLRFEIRVPFETAAFGGTTTISVPRSDTCDVCHGSGAAPGTGAKACPTCGGRGTTTTSQGAFAFSRPCPRCYGRGQIVERPCAACAGSGVRQVRRRIDVKIPAGVVDGAKIRLKGEGEPGSAGGPAGDVILTIRISGHAEFTRHGLDVESEVEIDMAAAALGATLSVDTLHGTVSLTVPAGVQPGTRLRLKGRGVEDSHGRKGDHYVRLKVVVPKKLTGRQRDLLEEFRSAEAPAG